MKRVLGLVAVIALAASPVIAQASLFISGGGEEYSRGPQDQVQGNLYAVAGRVSIASDVSGDLLVAGGNVTVSGRVGSDLAAAGGLVQVLGPVDGDARIAGGNITISDHIGGDLVVAGGTVHLLSGALVGGGLYVAGGDVIVDGTVQGPVSARVGSSLILTSSARIHGSVTYQAPHELRMDPGAQVGGQVTYQPASGMNWPKSSGMGMFWGVIAMVTAMKMVAILGLTALIVWLWRRWALSLAQDARDAFWLSVGRGLVYMILIPIAVVLLMISFVGILPGVLLAMAYGAAMILTKALTGIFLGAWLSAKIGKRKVLSITWLNALGGTILFGLLILVPILGMLAQAIVTLALFGVLAHSVQKQLASR